MNKKNKTSKDDPATGDRLGIKGLSKGKRKKLEAYQHLFYLLQVIHVSFCLIYLDVYRLHLPSLKGFSNTFLSPWASDQSLIPGQADLPDAPKQIY